MFRKPRPADGMATVWAIAWMVACAFVAAAVVVAAAAAARQHRVDAAADLAAVAAATAVSHGQAPCPIAAGVAARNAAIVTTCIVDGLDVTVRTEATMALPFGLHARFGSTSRAGPADDEIDASTTTGSARPRTLVGVGGSGRPSLASPPASTLASSLSGGLLAEVGDFGECGESFADGVVPGGWVAGEVSGIDEVVAAAAVAGESGEVCPAAVGPPGGVVQFDSGVGQPARCTSALAGGQRCRHSNM